MNILIYDPNHHNRNSYLVEKYFKPILDAGLATPLTEDVEHVKNNSIILHGENLTVELLKALKDNGNKVISFDINDNSALTYTYSNTNEVKMIDLIFKVSGIQKTQFDDDIKIGKDLTYTKKTVKFLDDANWKIYEDMTSSGRLISLPYIPWNFFYEGESVSWEQRNKGCSIRGGNHFLRFQLFLNLLKNNVCSDSSAFFARMYSGGFCQSCKDALKNNARISYEYFKSRKRGCNNPIIEWDKDDPVISDDFFDVNHCHWNNKCIPMFYWLSEKFQDTYGAIDMSKIEDAMNEFHSPNFDKILKQDICHGDFKWIFSIYAPPRFWEAAQTRSINIGPRFMNSQTYFPEMKEGDHYLTFDVDFSDLKSVIEGITKEKYEHITNNCKALFEKYIKGDTIHRMIVDKIHGTSRI